MIQINSLACSSFHTWTWRNIFSQMTSRNTNSNFPIDPFSTEACWRASGLTAVSDNLVSVFSTSAYRNNNIKHGTITYPVRPDGPTQCHCQLFFSPYLFEAPELMEALGRRLCCPCLGTGLHFNDANRSDSFKTHTVCLNRIFWCDSGLKALYHMLVLFI